MTDKGGNLKERLSNTRNEKDGRGKIKKTKRELTKILRQT